MSLLTAGLAVGGNIVNSLFNRGSQNSANRQNKQLAEYQAQVNREAADLEWSRNLDLWNMTNEYNSPSMQMERLKAAGLNPNLVYGNGSAANTASSPSAYDAAKYDAPNISSYTGFNTGFDEAIAAYNNSRLNSAQTSNLESQGDYVRAQTITEGLRQSQLLVQNARSEFDLNLAHKLEETSIDTAFANLTKLNADTRLSESNIALNQSRLELNEFQKVLNQAQFDNLVANTARLKQDYNFSAFEQSLKEIGIYPNDSLWQRIVGRVYRSLRNDPPKWGSPTKVVDSPPRRDYDRIRSVGSVQEYIGRSYD